MGWQRFRVELVGAEPVEVQTTARDWANVKVDDPGNVAPMDMTFRVVHNALRRQNVDVPASYDAFLDTKLDGIPEALNGENPFPSSPTGPAPSDAPP